MRDRYSSMDAAKAMYLLLHTITKESEAGKSLSEDHLAQAQVVLADADRLKELRHLVYAVSDNEREARIYQRKEELSNQQEENVYA